MRLRSSDGTQFELRPVRYQFAGVRGSRCGRDWDANWLVIRGDVQLADRRSWSFEDPCLTTWEARELAAWLRGVASGAVQPTPFEGGGEERTWMFTEPNLALSLAARDDVTATVRVHLSLEARPPWLAGDDPGEDPGELFEFFVEVTAPLNVVAQAADDWTAELATFPER
ncbi:MAG TPA: hypothetical protein VFS29_11530 [Motilibacteraceae bacterium]|nr:hypothetical protein [Motilibacteraceae bacterium]